MVFVFGVEDPPEQESEADERHTHQETEWQLPSRHGLRLRMTNVVSAALERVWLPNVTETLPAAL